MTTQFDKNQPILLRVRRNGQLDNVIRPLLIGEELTEEEVRDIANLQKMPRLLRTLDRWFDNLTVGQDGDVMTASYTDVLPKKPVPVSVKVEAPEIVNRFADVDVAPRYDRFIQSANGTAPEEDIDEDVTLVWPDVPPQIVPNDRFVKPDWYEDMKFAVKRGKHVSVASPPGVGKDTAIQQLSIEMGKPLVTIGGEGGFRKRDLIGQPGLRGKKNVFEVAEYAAAAVNGWWCLITEVNAADADAILTMNNQLAAPYTVNIAGRSYPVHPDFRLFISYNPGLQGTKPLPESFKDRFFPIKLGFLSGKEMRERLIAHGMPGKPVPTDSDVIPVVSGGRAMLLERERYLNDVNDWTDLVIKFYEQIVALHQDSHTIRYQITARRLIDAVLWMNEGGLAKDGPEGLRKALRKTVLSAIDNPIEAKAVDQVIRQLT